MQPEKTIFILEKFDVIVIGAGAAGLIAAGRAAELGGKVLLLEKMERAGRKLLITGKGRCNITNNAGMGECIKHIHPNGKYLRHAFSFFFNKDIVALLKRYGVETVVERGERVFPASNSSADVVNALVKYAKDNGVLTKYKSPVNKIITSEGIITGVEYTHEGSKFQALADKVIVCTGGCSYPATGSTGDGHTFAKNTGHTIEPVRPSLVPIETEGDLASQMQGLALKNVNAILWVNGKKYAEEFGEMLFAHFGLTGPIILTLSRMIVDELRKNSKVEIGIDLKPALDEQKLDQRLLRDLNEHGKKQVENIFKLWLPSSMIPVFMRLCEVDGSKECHQLSAKERRRILLLMKDFRFKVSGHRSFKEAIITAGGVSTQDIDAKTMESKKIKNLYFAGEVLDLDADTGGYNLQIAYSTAWVAAEACMKR